MFLKDWDWLDSWIALGIILVVGLIGIGVYAAFQDHRVKVYYMSDHGAGTVRNGYCVDGYREWWANEYGVFCSDDIEKSLMVLKQMNEGLSKK
jgi:hypothetical protein